MALVNLRCSSLPLISKCLSAAVKPQVPTYHDRADARLGTAVHKLLGDSITIGRLIDEAIPQTASEFRCNVEEVGRLARSAWSIWQEHFRKDFIDPVCEWELGGGLSTGAGDLHLTGHPDVIDRSEVDGLVNLLDFKTGFGDLDYSEQMKGYAFLLCLNTPFTKVQATVANIRTMTADRYQWDVKQLHDWAVKLCDRVHGAGSSFNPGYHCGFCPRVMECPGYETYVKHSAIHMQQGGLTVLQPNSPPNVVGAVMGHAIDLCRVLEAHIEKVREAVRSQVLLHGGRLPCGGDRELVLESQDRATVAVCDKSLEIIGDYVPAATIPTLLSIGKARLEGAVKHHAVKGTKGQQVQRCFEELDEAGCLVVTTTERLEMRRRQQVIEEQS